MLGALPEGQQVATEVQGVRPLRGNCLTRQSQTGKALRAQSPAIFLWYLTGCEWVWGDSPGCVYLRIMMKMIYSYVLLYN